MTSPTATEPLAFCARILRPGHDTLYLGFAFQHQAEMAVHSLRRQLTHTTHIPGTTIEYGSAPAGAEVIPPLPAGAAEIADAIDREDRDGDIGALFPDVFARLHAQLGYQDACDLHQAACAVLGLEDTPPNRGGAAAPVDGGAAETFEAKQCTAITALAAVIEDPQAGEFPQRRAALIDALGWLEAGMLCTPCLDGDCGQDGPQHTASAAARGRRARLKAAGLLP